MARDSRRCSGLRIEGKPVDLIHTSKPPTSKPPPEVLRVHVPELRAALKILERHRNLVAQALTDLGEWEGDLTSVSRALQHIVEDDFRGPRDRGGS